MAARLDQYADHTECPPYGDPAQVSWSNCHSPKCVELSALAGSSSDYARATHSATATGWLNATAA